MSLNEYLRMKMPAILHLCRLGYQYIPRNKQIWKNIIFLDLFRESINKINGYLSEQEVQKLLDVDIKELINSSKEI